MRIIEFLDSLVDTPQKRKLVTRMALWIMILAGLIPYILISIRLIDLSDYDSLFLLQSQLDHYRSCYLVRLILSLAATSGWPSIIRGILQSIHLFNIFFLLILFLNLLIPGNKRYKKGMILAGIGLIGVISGLACLAFGASSLDGLIRILRILGLFNCLTALILEGYCISRLIQWAASINS